MNMAKFLGNTLKSADTSVVVESIRAVTPPMEVLVQDDKVPEVSFWCVEEPFVVNQGIPSDLGKARNGKDPSMVNPTKTALHLFASFDEAALYGQRLNRNLVIFEIKPSATVRPQIALVSKIG